MCLDRNFIQQLSNGIYTKKLLCSITMIQMRTFITETERNLHHPLFPYPLQGRAHKLIYIACIVHGYMYAVYKCTHLCQS